MSNPNKARGTWWESRTRDYLNDTLGLYVADWRLLPAGVTKFRNPTDARNIKRQAQEGAHDVGDLHAHPFIIECKDVARPAVPAWIRQANVEAKHAGFPYGVVVHKTRGRNAQHARVHISAATWARVAHELGLTASGAMGRYGAGLTSRGPDPARWYVSMDLRSFASVLVGVRAGQSTH